MDGRVQFEAPDINDSLLTRFFSEQVSAGNTYRVEFNMASWVPGIYLIRTTVGEASAYGKLIVVR